MKRIKPMARATTMHKVSGEPWKGRHNRRLAVAMEHEKDAYGFSENNGITFKITNYGHHWQFRKMEWAADWWPVSAKLVLNHDFSKEIHCQDVGQVIAELVRRGWTNQNNFKRITQATPITPETFLDQMDKEMASKYGGIRFYSFRERLIRWLGGKI